jgi:hypothetical protein
MIRILAIRAAAVAAIGASVACTMATGPSDGETRTATAAVTAPSITPELLWQNKTSGQLEVWLLDGTSVESTPLFLSQLCGSGDGCSAQWTPVDTFNNTLLWWNRTTGQLRTWVIDASGNVTIPSDPTQTCGVNDGCVTASHDWRPIGRVLMNVPGANQTPGLLWHDPVSGTVRVWVFQSSNSQALQGSPLGTFDLTQTCGSALGCSQNWTAKLTGDFDHDGNTDILWWNTSTGVLQEWLLNPPSTLSPIPATVAPKQINLNLAPICEASNGCSTDWRPVGTADVNNDGHLDLLWHNFQGTFPGATPGALREWLLNGGTGAGGNGLLGTQDLSQACGPNCAPPWTALGFVSFPIIVN